MQPRWQHSRGNATPRVCHHKGFSREIVVEHSDGTVSLLANVDHIDGTVRGRRAGDVFREELT